VADGSPEARGRTRFSRRCKKKSIGKVSLVGRWVSSI
jgi:hypothetical protein